MSHPIRYSVDDDQPDAVYANENGHLVKWDDYAALAAENERLIRAGDAMADCINEFRRGRYGNALNTIGGFRVWLSWIKARGVEETQ